MNNYTPLPLSLLEAKHFYFINQFNPTSSADLLFVFSPLSLLQAPQRQLNFYPLIFLPFNFNSLSSISSILFSHFNSSFNSFSVGR